jgi:hypothetical protein
MKRSDFLAVSLSLLLVAPHVSAADGGATAAAPEAAPAVDTAAQTAAGSSAEVPEISEAEKLLWMGDQLKVIDKPSTLKYAFRKTGSYEQGFEDSVVFNVTEILPDGMKRANVNFFTGQRNLFVPPYESINGNVLLAIFLQGDVLEMKRFTEIGSRYFQQKIKYALATDASIGDTEIDFNGAKVPGKTVTIAPYSNDEKAETNERFRKFKDKVYTFTVSEQIPGFIYSIKTFVAAPKDAADQSQPLNEEVLQLTAVEPLQQPVAAAESGSKPESGAP